MFLSTRHGDRIFFTDTREIPNENDWRAIHSNEEFIAYGEKIDEAFSNWRNYADAKLKNLRADISTKDLIVKLAQSILREFEDLSLINKYDVY